ncbi:MAG: formate--tetrahydrofolate ligase [Candidatus Cyclonatronum sp.]|uniref:formate--tetrahydrofolate ligase n=1 Tax=Cyclonatronum sp. TaxID=3024185 RepID=UPI0025C62F46|nr:formate--tetrahydrofolate ligase [Cyclonatronum sp.]MCH8487098.1 formate--tetrahydrofolate ligase [Cyclonatronum sp.]
MTDIDIAQSVELRDIREIASRWGILEDDLMLYGKHKAKLPLHLINEEKIEQARLVLVSAISPTPAGEGKTTVTIGLSEAMNQTGRNTIPVLREPSLGPVFGMKGGATGGGYAQVLPMEDINLHFTGDFSAIEKAHNLLSALIANNLHQVRDNLDIDPRTVHWKRVMDMNDRSLRHIITGLGGTTSGIPRETGFDITAASEIMAILCLADDLENLKERFGNIFVGFTFDGRPVYARDLKATGAMAALMKDAIKPNLVQTIEGNAAIIHGGPFANIAQGTNSVIATRMGLSLADYVITEAGFGFDLGAEKFFDIKCRAAGLKPQAVVLVATIRALKYHGGAPLNELKRPDVARLKAGIPNLEKHLENIGHFGVPAVVAINRFATDSDEEIEALQAHFEGTGVEIHVADVWAKGGAGAHSLADAVARITEANDTKFTPLYDNAWSVEQKIEAICRTIYGAKAIDYTLQARKDLRKIAELGLDKLPVCIAKTQKSLSDNPELLGRPKDFIVTIREIELAAGAGFLIPITGTIVRMPGLPARPAAESIDIDRNGKITGLF